MGDDLSPVLNDWPFDPEQMSVRIIQGDDGRRRVQLRLDLGILQMEVDGRPDGQLVEGGAASYLDHYRKLQREHDAAHPDAARFLLDGEDCAKLLREGVQYYHRYISFWHLKQYELCARDTRRNLQLFEFVREHARHDRDKMQFDQWRPYVTMMHARAVATPLVELEQYEAAASAIEAGIKGIESFLSDYGQADKADQLSELVFLKRWRREVGKLSGAEREEDEDTAADPVVELRRQLEEAIASEEYETAATLRDELRRLEEPPPPNPIG